MKLHIFQSIKMPELFGFTVDPTDANLSADGSQWEDIGAPTPLNAALETAHPNIAEDIERDGYSLIKSYKIAGRL